METQRSEVLRDSLSSELESREANERAMGQGVNGHCCQQTRSTMSVTAPRSPGSHLGKLSYLTLSHHHPSHTQIVCLGKING